jgi:hypothetical protein
MLKVKLLGTMERIHFEPECLQEIGRIEKPFHRDFGDNALGEPVIISGKKIRILFRVRFPIAVSKDARNRIRFSTGAYLLAYGWQDDSGVNAYRIKEVTREWARSFAAMGQFSLREPMELPSIDEVGDRERQTTSKKVIRGKAKGGRKRGRKLRISKWEHEALERYCRRDRVCDIDYDLATDKHAVRGTGAETKKWKHGDASRVIRAAKTRKDYFLRQMTNGDWEIVRNMNS